MHNTLPNHILPLRFLGLKKIIYFLIVTLIALALFLKAAWGFFVPPVEWATYRALATGFLVAAYLRQWYYTQRAEFALKYVIDTADRSMIALGEAMVQNEALVKVLKKLDRHMLRKTGAHLVITDEKEKRLPN